MHAMEKLKLKWMSMMSDPNSRRMQNFNYVVTLLFFFDLGITSLVMAKHAIFFEGDIDDEHMPHKLIIWPISLVQIGDIILNFFRTFEERDKAQDSIIHVNDPWRVTKKYL